MMQSLVLVDLPILKKIEQHAEAPDFKLNPCRFMSLAGCLSFGHRQIKQLMEDFPVLESFVGPECAIPLTSGVLISKPIGNDVSQLDSGQRKTVLARGFARKIPPLEKEQANKKTHVLQKAKQDRQAALVLQQQMAAKSAEHVASVAENQRLERNREEFQEQEKAEEKAKQDKVQYIEDRLARRALRQRMEGLYKVEAPKLPKLKNPFRSSKLRL